MICGATMLAQAKKVDIVHSHFSVTMKEQNQEKSITHEPLFYCALNLTHAFAFLSLRVLLTLLR